jgi:hypothetical protein
MEHKILNLKIMNSLSIRFAIIFSAVLFQPIHLDASNPGKVEGTITDAETYQTVPFAVIELLKSQDSTLVQATTSNNDGKYQFEDVANGNYLLRISCLGYRKKTIPEFEITADKPEIKFGVINLLTESTKLKEVVVTAHKLTGIMENDKTIYTIKSKSGEMAQSGIELLRLLPDVTVDYISENVKLAGSSNILFEVNGRKVDKNYLVQLNPELVDKIEVITNPGAKYDSGTDAIINIILKKNRQYGLSGRARVTLPNSSAILLTRNNVSVDLFLKNLRVYMGGYYNQYHYNRETTNNRNTFSQDTVTLIQKAACSNTGKQVGFNYGADWFINDKNIFNFYSTIRPQMPDESKIVSDNTYNSTLLNSHNESQTKSVNKSFFYDYSVFFLHKFAKKNHEISIESYLSNTNNKKNSYYFERDYISGTVFSDVMSNRLDQYTEDRNKQWIVKVDYTYPFSEKVKLNAGYNGYILRTDYTYKNLLEAYSDVLNYDENRQAIYGNISWVAGNFSIQPGIRYEFSDIQLTHTYETTNKYDFLLPSLSALYKLGKNNALRLSYRKSITRPGVNQLSPINYKEDSYLQLIGNPDLAPGYGHRIEFNHRIQLGEPLYLSYKPYIVFLKNNIRLITQKTTDLIVVKKYANVGNDFEYGLSLSGTLNVLKRWTTNASLTCFQRNLNSLPEYGINTDSKHSSWRLYCYSQYELPKDWTLLTECNFYGPTTDYQTIIKGNCELKIGVNKIINKKINVSMIAYNPWRSSMVNSNKTETTSNMVQSSKDVITYNYLVFIRLGYKFNVGKVGKKVERPVETKEEVKGIFN